MLALPAASVVSTLLVGPRAMLDRHPAWLAAVSLALLGWHHAFSRADPSHLAQSSIPPLAIAALGLDAIGCGSLALGLALPATWLFRPWFGLSPGCANFGLVRAAGWSFSLPVTAARLLEVLRVELAKTASESDGPLVVLPTLVWLLPMLGLRSPIYDTFCVYAASDEEQGRMIEEIETRKAHLAAVSLTPLDELPARAFPATHPRVMAWLEQHFQPVATDLPSELRVMRRR